MACLQDISSLKIDCSQADYTNALWQAVKLPNDTEIGQPDCQEETPLPRKRWLK